MKRNTKKEDEEISSESEEDVPKKKLGKKSKTKKINWAGVFILCLFVIPSAFAAFLYAYDYLYPQAALARQYREKLVRCYTDANPEKLSDIDYLLKKYEGNEPKLFGQLRDKYAKYPACQFHP